MIANKEYPWQHFFPLPSNQLLNPNPDMFDIPHIRA